MTDNEILESAISLVSEGIAVTFPVKGVSMLPFIIGSKERVILVRPDGAAVGDVVLAWVEGCRYVVHRIIRIEGNRVTLMGDGNVGTVEHCSLADVKAKADYVVDARGRRHYLYVRWRRWAARVWYWLRPLRRYILYIYRRI